jgi:hypothetical protein
MRRPLIVGVVLGAVLAVAPMASHAATSPSVTLITPTSEDLARGVVSIKWSYAGFHRTTPIDVEVREGSGAFQRIARVAIDDGTPGYFGTASWSTTSADDATDWTVRIAVPTNKSVTSSASPIAVDNSGPTTTITSSTVAVLSVAGDATDEIAGVASVAATFTDGTGNETTVEATCDCAATPATWTASALGVAPGQYTVTAVATDVLGNVGEAASAELLVVGTPPDPTPALLEAATGIVNPVVETATGLADGTVETATGLAGDMAETATGLVGDVAETVTDTTNNPPTADETVEAATGTADELFGTVLGLTEAE